MVARVTPAVKQERTSRLREIAHAGSIAPRGRRRLLTTILGCGDPYRLSEHYENMAPMDHSSFRDILLFSIGFAIGQQRDLLRRMLSEHATDATRDQLAKRVVEHLELSGFEIDEPKQIMKRRPPTHGYG
jgi:hypothetical protein